MSFLTVSRALSASATAPVSMVMEAILLERSALSRSSRIPDMTDLAALSIRSSLSWSTFLGSLGQLKPNVSLTAIIATFAAAASRVPSSFSLMGDMLNRTYLGQVWTMRGIISLSMAYSSPLQWLYSDSDQAFRHSLSRAPTALFRAVS